MQFHVYKFIAAIYKIDYNFVYNFFSLRKTKVATNKLTAKFCEIASKGTHFDGEGLYLLVRPDGKRYWHMACYFEGKRKLLSFGSFPKISLDKARKARKKAQELLSQGIDPVQHKKDLKQSRVKAEELKAQAEGHSFEQVARRLYVAKAGKVTEEYRDRMLRQLELHLFPHIGKKHVNDIKGAELLAILRKVAEKTNHGRPMTYMASKLCQWSGEIFDYAMVENHEFTNNPSRAVGKHLPKHNTKNMARIRFSQLPEFMVKLDNYNGYELTKSAILLLLYTGMRQISVRRAQWKDFDFDSMIWHRQPEKGDSRIHKLPLPTQAIELLDNIKPLTIDKPDALAMPSVINPYNPMSEAAICQALKRMGYDMVGHGLRSVVSTGLNELGYPPHIVETQIGHKHKDRVEAAYNKAEYFEERGKMMQEWANYLDAIKQEEIKKGT